MLTVILISSSIIAVYSPSMILKVGFTSAAYATSSENNDDNNEGEEEQEQPITDAPTDGEEVVDDDDGGDVQEQDNAEEEQLSSSTQEEGGDGEEQQEQGPQLAMVAGEICDDFEDNDGDGFIDLADADCAAPLTEGTVTAPTTPTPPSVINTTATNSTNNTLTASGIAGLDRPYDLEKDCKSYEELGIPPPPPGFGVPPNAKWYDCGGVGVPSIPPDSTTTTNSGTEGAQGLTQGGGVQGQQQTPSSPATPPTTTTSQEPPQQEPNVEICDDFEDNDGDGFVDFLDNDCAAPSTLGAITAPTGQQGEQPPSPPPQQEPNVEICDDFEDNDGDGLVDLVDEDCAGLLTGGAVTNNNLPNSIDDGQIWTHYPDGSKQRTGGDGATTTVYPDGTVKRLDKRGNTFTSYPEGVLVMEEPNGRLGVFIGDFSPEGWGFTQIILDPNGISTIEDKGGPGEREPRRLLAQPEIDILYSLVLALAVQHP